MLHEQFCDIWINFLSFYLACRPDRDIHTIAETDEPSLDSSLIKDNSSGKNTGFLITCHPWVLNY